MTCLEVKIIAYFLLVLKVSVQTMIKARISNADFQRRFSALVRLVQYNLLCLSICLCSVLN